MGAWKKRCQKQNLQLYRDGERYLPLLQHAVDGRYAKDALRRVAKEHGTSVSEVRTAADFVSAVDHIAAVAGESARELLLSGVNPLLTPALIAEISGLREVEVRSAMQRAADQFHPWAPTLPASTSPKLAVWEYHVRRLHQAVALLGRDESSPTARSLLCDDRMAVHRDSTALRVATAALKLSLNQAGRARSAGCDNMCRGCQERVPNPQSLTTARRLVEAVTHDLPLVLWQCRPPGTILNQLSEATQQIQITAAGVADLTCPPPLRARRRTVPAVQEGPDGPAHRRGTYVVVYQAKAGTVQRIGRLETYWVPAGLLLYVGSALGAGGVRARTDRHCDTYAPLRWNIDHLKAIARPVELWWAYAKEGSHRTQVECPWAMALAGLPGYCCPAPGFGSNDCQSCPAHLYHSLVRPSCEEFAELVQQTIPGHGTIYRKVLD
jgi:Uri superfamily endonuclease